MKNHDGWRKLAIAVVADAAQTVGAVPRLRLDDFGRRIVPLAEEAYRTTRARIVADRDKRGIADDPPDTLIWDIIGRSQPVWWREWQDYGQAWRDRVWLLDAARGGVWCEVAGLAHTVVTEAVRDDLLPTPREVKERVHEMHHRDA